MKVLRLSSRPTPRDSGVTGETRTRSFSIHSAGPRPLRLRSPFIPPLLRGRRGCAQARGGEVWTRRDSNPLCCLARTVRSPSPPHRPVAGMAGFEPAISRVTNECVCPATPHPHETKTAQRSLMPMRRREVQQKARRSLLTFAPTEMRIDHHLDRFLPAGAVRT